MFQRLFTKKNPRFVLLKLILGQKMKRKTKEILEIVKSDRMNHQKNVRPVSSCELPAGYIADAIFVKPLDNDYYIKVFYEDIVWIEAENNYSHIHHRDGKRTTLAFNLKKVHGLLPNDIFFRINRSEIVNIRYVNRYCGRIFHCQYSNHQFSVSDNFVPCFFTCFHTLKKES